MANREESPRFKWPFPSWKADWQEWQQIFRDLVNNIDAALFGMVEAQYLIFKELPDVQIVETSPGVYQFIPSAQAVFISRTNHVEIRTTEDRLTLQPDAFVVVALTPGAVGPQVTNFELVQQGMDISPNLIPLGYVGTDYSIYWYNGSHLPVGKMMRLFETGEGGGGEVRKAAVLSIADCTLPPPTENLHDRYILDMTGPVHADWDGAAQNDIVDFGGVSWLHETPEEGWVCLVDDADVDAVFVDDPPVPAHWENRVIPVGVWDAGAGVSAIKRTADLVGLADGDYALNAGWGGNAEADYSFNGNGANVITDDSSYTSAFGDANVVGDTLRSRYSLVAGHGHSVNGYDDRGDIQGDNAVFGRAHVVNAQRCVVGGFGNIVDFVGNAVFGRANTVPGFYSLVAGHSNVLSSTLSYGFISGYDNAGFGSDFGMVVGEGNDVGMPAPSPYSAVVGYQNSVNGTGSGWNYVFGYEHDVDCDFSFVFGESHNVMPYSKHTATFGYGHAISPMFGAPDSIVTGRSNTLNGSLEPGPTYKGGNALFGENNQLQGKGSLVSGINIVAPNTTYSAIFGYGHTITTAYQAIVSGMFNVVVSADSSAIFGYNNSVGATIPSPDSIFAGKNNILNGFDAPGPDVGSNALFGEYNQLTGWGSIVAGKLNVITSNGVAIFGESHSVTNVASGVLVSGSGNIIVDSPYSLVFGRLNSLGATISAPESIVGGHNNVVDGYAAPGPVYHGGHAVFGEDHQVGSYCLTTLVTGRANTLSGSVDSAVLGTHHSLTGFGRGLVSGGYNSVTSSNDSAVFGYNNFLGITKSSPYSLVAGKSNSVDASTIAPTAGHNYVFGESNNVDCDYAMVFGLSNTVSDIYGAVSTTAVFGTANIVGNLIPSPFSIIVGSSNTVNGFSPGPPPAPTTGNNAVFGGGNTVNGSYIFMAGSINAILAGGGDYSAVFGFSHILQTTSTYSLVSGFDHTLTNARHCVVGGYQNTVAGMIPSYNGANAVFGRANNVSAEYSLVAGYTNSVSSNTSGCVVGGRNHSVTSGSQCAVFGQNHTVNGQNHVVGGAYNTVTGVSACAVFGLRNEATFGATPATFSLVYGTYAKARFACSLVAANGFNDWGSGQRRAQTLVNMPVKGYTRSSPVEWVSLTGHPPNPLVNPIRISLDQACFWQMDVVASKENVTPGLPALKSWTVKFLTYRDTVDDVLIPISSIVEAMTNNSDEASWDVRVRVISNYISIEVWGSDDASNAVAWSIRLRNTEVNAMQMLDA